MKRSLALLPFLVFTLHAAPVPLFDGKSLDGWEGDAKLWRVEDGMLTGGSLTEKVVRNDFLATKKSYANFELRVLIRLSGTEGFINSGVQIRSVRVPGSPEMSGYQVDYGKGWYGKLYDESRRNKVVAEAKDLTAATAAIKEGEWNEYRIRVEGPRIRSWINGVPALDYTEPDPNIPQDGHLGIQVHGGGKALVQVKEIAIEELPPTPGAPTWDKLGGFEGVRAKVAPPKPGAAAPSKPMKEGNAASALPRTPEEERTSFTLPAGFEAELVAAEDPANGIGKFVPIAFDQHGALWTTTALEYPVDGNENPAAADALYASKARDKVLVYDRDPRSLTGYAAKPRVFADGLAIPLGVLPYKNGCYVQHGHDIAFLEDTDADGRADKRTVILSGFGVQDSHLFPHQFLRAPGGWIWLAQGLFNRSAVKTKDGQTVEFDMCRMAKFRPDGSGFEPTSVGPNNIWGLVLNGEGEAFIQEANDYGYPVMPFHEYALYPGGADRLAKSYQPPFPPAADFRMGGTGLSGLALLDAGWARLLNQTSDQPAVLKTPITNHQSPIASSSSTQTVLVANPITNRIQGIAMHRDGPYWKLDAPFDFLVSSDPWFRPVAIANGPDGCLYIVDWYNRIISHNEVPRNHPDRDKTRGRIWRVKAKAAPPFAVPDFTKLSGNELIAKLGGESLTQSHLAWQAIGDRGMAELTPKLGVVVESGKFNDAARIQALWALEALQTVQPDQKMIEALLSLPNRNVRREAIASAGRSLLRETYEGGVLSIEDPFYRAVRSESTDSDPESRAEVIRAVARIVGETLRSAGSREHSYVAPLVKLIESPLAGPTAPGSRGKPVKVREAYDRDFERYLVRMFLERHPDAVAKFLDSDAARELPVEARLLASLALEPRASAARVARLLPQLQRAPGQEEVLRLAEFPSEPGVGDALRALLSQPPTRDGVIEALLATRTRLDEAKLAPLLSDAAKLLLNASDPASVQLGAQLAGAFRLANVENILITVLKRVAPAPARAVSGAPPETTSPAPPHETSGEAPNAAREARALPIALTALRALSEIDSVHSELFASIAETSPDAALRDEALAALASSRAADAPARLLALYPRLDAAQRRSALERLAGTRPGAQAIVAALNDGKLNTSTLEAAVLDRLQTVLGDRDPALARLVDRLGALFRPVLALDGTDAAWTQTDLTLDGPCTIEAWVRLDPDKRKITNIDGLFGAPGQLDFNFFGERARIYAFPPLGDVVVAKKPITPGLWTHITATRDTAGLWKLYLDGELDAVGTKPAPGKIENARLAWTTARGGPRGALAELRVWNRERTADEIRAASDRSLPADTPGLIFTTTAGTWGKPQAGAKVIKTSDFPPLLTTAEAAALDAKYAKYRALAAQPGDAARGKAAAAVCAACHLLGTAGGNIGPNLSGVGAMGLEAILRNILQPNAAMENGYRIYRVELKNGDLADALFVSEDADAVVVRLPGTDDRRIAKKDIHAAKYLRRSLMPEGLLDTFSDQQASDLFAYLLSLK